MQKPILIAVTALAATSLACSVNLNVPRVEVGPEETVTVSEAAPTADGPADTTIRMGAGKLTLTGGGEGWVSGEIRYNVPDWAPEITNSGEALEISQAEADLQGIPDGNVVNEWDLALGDVPMNLEVNAGAYEGTLDLSGVPLHGLTVHEGAAKTTVSFDAPNPAEMDTLSYDTGASSVTLTGLANANFETMTFNGGAGEFTLDFSGELQRDAAVTLKLGLSSARIEVPADMAVTVTVTGGLNDVDTEGTWTASGDTYTQAGSGPALTISVDMGAGSLKLISE
jgi:hypothetical protein